MKHITIPKDTTFKGLSKDGLIELPLRFRAIIVELLDHAPQFGTRAGARKAVAIEAALAAENGVCTLTEDQHALLLEAVNAFSWIPAAAKVMEKAGWFEAIENAV